MNAIDQAMINVIKQMPKDDLEHLIFVADEFGLDGIVERGGDKFRELAAKERVSIEVSLGAILCTANEIDALASNVGGEILEEEMNK